MTGNTELIATSAVGRDLIIEVWIYAGNDREVGVDIYASGVKIDMTMPPKNARHLAAALQEAAARQEASK